MHGQTWPVAGTQQAAVMASNWLIFLAVASCVAVVVLGLIFFSLVRWRRRPGDAEPPQFSNNMPIEIAWTVVPLLIVGGLFVATYRAEARVDAIADRPAAIVAVNAYRWGWTFAYRGGPTVGGSASAPAEFG
ncbi:MAG: cytochrome c oxidase subunit II, partial [Candidatus Eremiobacteraeota bacterium]|nr:cytochrome c oxidase subunit II [Candidatus Eremiobacteraeota bacterium]